MEDSVSLLQTRRRLSSTFERRSSDPSGIQSERRRCVKTHVKAPGVQFTAGGLRATLLPLCALYQPLSLILLPHRIFFDFFRSRNDAFPRPLLPPLRGFSVLSGCSGLWPGITAPSPGHQDSAQLSFMFHRAAFDGFISSTFSAGYTAAGSRSRVALEEFTAETPELQMRISIFARIERD